MATNISFLTVPNLVTCSEVTIQWTYNGTTPSTPNYPLVVTNIGVSQSGLSRREVPLVARQSTTTVNTTLAVVNASTGRFNWPKVNIPQGWYRMDIYATSGVIPSNTFNVTNGLDVSCVVAPSQPSVSSSLTSLTPNSTYSLFPSTSSTSSTSVTTSTVIVGNSSVKRRAIVGGVVGGVALLTLIAAVALWLSHRRRKRTRNATPPSTLSRIKGQACKANHNSSDSTGAILPLGRGSWQNSRQLSILGDDFASEKFAVADDDTMPRLPSVAATRSYPTSSRRPTSMIQPSFESCESRPSSPPSNNSRYPPDRTRRASRKPVPVYDPSEFPGSDPNGIPLSDSPESILGGGTKVYYIIPDAPLEQRKRVSHLQSLSTRP
jgi:hypothetical protein